ncbi:peptidoglycan-associated lipoprotein [Candidatus Desulfofervidus auxilii]|uniref:Peptidoglycan-associated protein n=2 Tax=Desulfofervidus auxilii TaxID=1621989 RepID=A0A7U4QKG7_DESA2|nr:peptidoglycan-associated lipoprotein Pal [Candidatus Desulfofervidus auxilii]CAD7776096.1 OmpA family protein [Candidatus Methanoperedenaceae archaeon GB50]CAD7780628.1 MAG: OmpA family protein [Candidatus Methanoperedenaceae archaeon GB37]AMM41018.1 peptidoglycan-associated lipoprotein [Candidatus Desulfofervidus auxilii]MDL1966144.1 peptidoglycan-associated lipoprotein Pal [Candidatus Desulfofervidus auxilii]CAD7782701.1 MAG: OmpA family protein [Candidatus Methanoperedenaceae archaeon GB
MKRGILVLVLSLMVVFPLGCAKKMVEKPVSVQPEQIQPLEEVKPPEEGKVVGMKEEAITEEELARQQKIQIEETLKEEMAKFENEDIHFDFDKYYIRPDAAEILKKKAQWLKEHPEVHLLIEGHCDERGTEEYNLALGERRANSAKEFLVSLGIDPKRISIISYGEERPVDPRSCEEAWAKNRRDHFVIISY